MTLVLDASAAVELALWTERGRRVADRLGDDLFAPELLDVEALAALARLVRSGDVRAEDADTAVAALLRLPLTRVSHLALAAGAWRLRDRVRLADAFYASCAALLSAPLLTCDGRLARAPLPGVSVLLVP